MKGSNGFSFFLGIRNFYSFSRGKKRTMIGAAAASALAIIPLIVVLHVSDGMIEGITRRFIEIETGHLNLIVHSDADTEELKRLSSEISSVEGFLYAAPVCSGPAVIYSEDFKSGIQVKGMPQDRYEKDAGFRKYMEIVEGRFSLGDGSIMLSSRLAEMLGADPGSSVKMLTVRTFPGGRSVLRPEQFTVSAVFETGYYEIDSMTAYIGLEKAIKLFPDSGAGIVCKITDPYRQADAVAEELNNRYGNELSAVTWFRMQRSMYESLNTTRRLLVFIMSVIVIVASINIASSMLIMLIEKARDIAILKSCGAGKGQIRNAFIITGVLTGLAGSIAGTAAGLLISLNINKLIRIIERFSGIIMSLFSGNGDGFSIISASSYYLEEIPVHIRGPELLLITAGAVILSALSALHPSAAAERLSPGNIIQKH